MNTKLDLHYFSLNLLVFLLRPISLYDHTTEALIHDNMISKIIRKIVSVNTGERYLIASRNADWQSDIL